MFLTPLVVRAAPFALSGRTQGATARHVTTPTPECYFSTEWPGSLMISC